MRWSDEEIRIVGAAETIVAAVRALRSAGFERTKQQVTSKRLRLGLDRERRRGMAWGIPTVWPRHNQAAARRVATFIERHSPMTAEEYEAGMRRLNDA